MDWLKRFVTSTIGLKIIMAVSGIVMVGFVIAHMAGNLQVFLGPVVFNKYSQMLQGTELVWVLRAGLLGAVVAHIGAVSALVGRARAARPQGYGAKVHPDETRTVWIMRLGGLTLLAFIVFHILHMTTGTIHVSGIQGVEFEHCQYIGDDFKCFAYGNLVSGLRVWYVALFYLIAQVALGLHLVHGTWSMFRTLGLDNPRWDTVVRNLANGVAIVTAGGNIFITLAILAGIVTAS